MQRAYSHLRAAATVAVLALLAAAPVRAADETGVRTAAEELVQEDGIALRCRRRARSCVIGWHRPAFFERPERLERST